jgi:hypothetical protein
MDEAMHHYSLTLQVHTIPTHITPLHCALRPSHPSCSSSRTTTMRSITLRMRTKRSGGTTKQV